jgi:outer membrane protein OmpA-like peptidoglycan-associated protein
MTTDARHEQAATTRRPGRAGRVLGAAGMLAFIVSVGTAVIVRTNGGDRGTAAPPSPAATEAPTSTAHTTSPPPARLAPAGSTAATDPTTTPPPTTVTPATTAVAAVPEPILVVFDGERVTLDGAVPSEETKSYLETLAAANAKGAATIENRLTVNPSVPLTVPVRVIELQSERFPSGRAEIVPAQAVELDRVANVMLAFPSVTLLVIGHADQVGSEAANLELSQARAGAVVTYLVSKGVGVDRLSARGVGETDLLADDLGADALALNRRTEFVFTGILAPPTTV